MVRSRAPGLAWRRACKALNARGGPDCFDNGDDKIRRGADEGVTRIKADAVAIEGPWSTLGLLRPAASTEKISFQCLSLRQAL